MDFTHDPALQSWVESANDPRTDFPIQNLPLGVFSEGSWQGIGVGIGDRVLRVADVIDKLHQVGPLDDAVVLALRASDLRGVMALSKPHRVQLRHRLSTLLSSDCPFLRDDSQLRESALRPSNALQPRVPLQITDYSDFYASIYHATNVGSMFRPDNPLLPNYKWVPIGYHGRCSTIVSDGTPIRRPQGQLTPESPESPPEVAACRQLDYELEVGIWVAEENEIGLPTPIEAAEDRLFGICLLNDWSARDLQRWEYQPLGPFLAKSFATTISPWVVTAEALEPYRAPAFQRAEGDPQPLAYLDSAANRQQGAIDLTLEVHLSSERMRAEGLAPLRLSSGSFLDLYWTPAQMITHHASNGCRLRPGDLIGSGTVSGRARESRGCLLERTWDGSLDQPLPGTARTPIRLPTGEERKFLADGDEVTLTGYCQREGYRRIGLGWCRGTILPALEG